MHGNVFEWTLDWYAAFCYESKTDPLGPSSELSKCDAEHLWYNGETSIYVQHLEEAHQIVRSPNVFRLAFKYIPNQDPIDLNFTGSLAFDENLPIGTTFEFNATDPDGDSITYHLVDENGSTNNNLFTLDQNGTLKPLSCLITRPMPPPTRSVQAKDEFNATIEKEFSLTLKDINNLIYQRFKFL